MPPTPSAGPAAPRLPRAGRSSAPTARVDVELTAGDEDARSATSSPALRARRSASPRRGSVGGLDAGWPTTCRSPRRSWPTARSSGWAARCPAAGARDRSSALELHVVGGPDAGRTSRSVGAARARPGRRGHRPARRSRTSPGGTSRSTSAAARSPSPTSVDQRQPARRPRPRRATRRPGRPARSCAWARAPSPSPGPAAPPAALEPAPGGRLRLRPIPRMTVPPRRDVEVAFPRPPAPPPRRRLAWVAVALPAVGGVLMAGCCTPRRSCSSPCSARWSPWAPGCPTAGRAGAADAGTRPPTPLEVLAAQDRLADAVARRRPGRRGRPSRPRPH